MVEVKCEALYKYPSDVTKNLGKAVVRTVDTNFLS